MPCWIRVMIVVVILTAGGWVATPGVAQTDTQTDPPAYLIADEILYRDDGTLVAQGNVDIIQGETRLRATRITYTRDGDQLVIEGPLRLNDGAGMLVLSDSAELDRGFRNGLLRGARLLLDGQLQLAAADARRADGRLTQLRRVVATSCHVCDPGRPPIWQIRATSVLHDQEARQLYFENAQLRIFDLPVVYLPRLRLPDPTLRRARGFLIPELQSSTLLGVGLKMPYFIPLGDHADLTVSPLVSNVTRTLDMRLRRAFATGYLEANGALSEDSLQSGLRGYLFAEGQFDLERNITLRFDLEVASDTAYLSDYDYSEKDRLDSALSLEQVKENQYNQAAIIHYQSLRETEGNATQPTIVTSLSHETAMQAPWSRGVLRFGADMRGHLRTSEQDVVGRDMWRLHADARYLDNWTLPMGLRLGIEAGLAADHITTLQDSTSDPKVTQITPAATLTLRWPLMRQGRLQQGRSQTVSQTGLQMGTKRGAGHLLEPVMQLGWTGGRRAGHVSDETQTQEFDEGNLLALSRFPASDRRQRGAVGIAGMRWLRYDPAGWSSGVTLGRIWRENPGTDFSLASGLQGDRSNWLVAAQYTGANGLSVGGRGLFDGSSRANSAEARAAWTGDRFGLDASYMLEIADAAENRPVSHSEWNISGHYDVTRNWTASTNWRYDLAADNLARAGLRLQYSNECVNVGFFASRRFASSANVEPSTKFGLTVTLKGFSTGGQATPKTRTCSS